MVYSKLWIEVKNGCNPRSLNIAQESTQTSEGVQLLEAEKIVLSDFLQINRFSTLQNSKFKHVQKIKKTGSKFFKNQLPSQTNSNFDTH